MSRSLVHLLLWSTNCLDLAASLNSFSAFHYADCVSWIRPQSFCLSECLKYRCLPLFFIKSKKFAAFATKNEIEIRRIARPILTQCKRGWFSCRKQMQQILSLLYIIIYLMYIGFWIEVKGYHTYWLSQLFSLVIWGVVLKRSKQCFCK